MEKTYLDIEIGFAKKFHSIFQKPAYKDIRYVERGFHSIKEIEQDSLLFVGLNPSYDESKPNISSHFYSLEQRNNEYQKFFGKFEKASEKTALHWSHLDVLVMRETKQKSVQELLNDDVGKEFIKEQIKVTKEILEQSKPKVIVVANTLARNFLGKDGDESINFMGYKFEFNKTLGTDLITNSEELKGVPVFFTSMLSGQRALDNGSYERLLWHIDFALRSLPQLAQI